MDNKTIRMRCIEAITATGIREVSRTLRDAGELEKWVHAAEPDKEPSPAKRTTKKVADKD